MIVLGIDPSFCATGLAAIGLSPTGERILETGVIRTAPQHKKRHILVGDDDARRVTEIAQGIDAWIRKYAPVAIVVEAPAGSKHARAARALALSVGTVITTAVLRGIPLVQVQPLDVKRAVCGRKNAAKEEMIAAVEQRFPEVKWPSPASVVEHAADAIGAVLAGEDSPVIQMARKLAQEKPRAARKIA
jgi:crossover junction endodeoxyribonuclease RuvC